jgi:hypothetical protein
MTQLAEEKKQSDERLNRIHAVNIELLTFKKLSEKNETIYIVSSRHYASQGIYKIGRTKCMKTRLSGHNNTHVTGDRIVSLKEYKVNDSIAIENYIHRKLKGLLVPNEKEFFICPYDLLESIINAIINDDDQHNTLVNNVIDLVYTLKCSDYSPSKWMEGINPSVFDETYSIVSSEDKEETKAVFNVTLATLEQKKEFVLQCVQAYKTTIEQPNQIQWLAFQVFLKAQLQIKEYKYRALGWKSLFNEVNQ